MTLKKERKKLAWSLRTLEYIIYDTQTISTHS